MKYAFIIGLLGAALSAVLAYRQRSRLDLPPTSMKLKAYKSWVAEVNEDARRRAALGYDDGEDAA